MNQEILTTVTYLFANGTKVVQPITKEFLYNERNKKRTAKELATLLADTAWDKRAIAYTLDGNFNEDIVVTEKEVHFTKEQRKTAKRDYKEMQKLNPAGFKNSRKQFQGVVTDKFGFNKYPLRFNLKQPIQFAA